MDDKTKTHIEELYTKIKLRDKMLLNQDELISELTQDLRNERKITTHFLDNYINADLAVESKLSCRIIEHRMTIKELEDKNNKLEAQLNCIKFHNELKGYKDVR